MKSWEIEFTCIECGKSYPIRRALLEKRKTQLCKSCLAKHKNRTPAMHESSRWVGLLKPSSATKQKLSQSMKRYYECNGNGSRDGENNPAWKGGNIIVRGYRLLYKPDHPRATIKGQYVFEHILVVEEYLGRYLTKDEVVHHINKNKLDNRIENLQVMTPGEHIRLHNKERNYYKNKKLS